MEHYGHKCTIQAHYFLKRFYLFLGRWEMGEKERERNINVCCLSRTPNWGPGSQPRQV